MARELKKHQLVERSLIKKYRKSIWNPFIECIKGYSLLEPNDIVGIRLEGSAESVLCAKLMQQLKRVSEFDFELKILANENALSIAKDLCIPLCDNIEACNKIINLNCYDDVIEKVMHSMLYEHKIEAVTPMIKTDDAVSISPLYCIARDSIYAFSRYNELGFEYIPPQNEAMRSVQEIITDLKNKNEGIDRSIFKGVHAVCLDTLPGYEQNGEYHFFTNEY